MVSWVPHLVLPLLVALAFFRTLPRRWVWWLAPVVWLPDLDYLSPGEHRVFSHNVWIPLGFLVAFLVLWRRRAPALPWTQFAAQPGLPVALALVSYYWASHVLLDVFAGGVVLFWPILNTNFYLDYEIYIDTKTNTPIPQGEAGTSQGAPEVDPMYPWLTYEHTAFLAFLAACLLGWLAVRVVRAWREARKA